MRQISAYVVRDGICTHHGNWVSRLPADYSRYPVCVIVVTSLRLPFPPPHIYRRLKNRRRKKPCAGSAPKPDGLSRFFLPRVLWGINATGWTRASVYLPHVRAALYQLSYSGKIKPPPVNQYRGRLRGRKPVSVCTWLHPHYRRTKRTKRTLQKFFIFFHPPWDTGKYGCIPYAARLVI